jgi:hypothetical protein
VRVAVALTGHTFLVTGLNVGTMHHEDAKKQVLVTFTTKDPRYRLPDGSPSIVRVPCHVIGRVRVSRRLSQFGQHAHGPGDARSPSASRARMRVAPRSIDLPLHATFVYPHRRRSLRIPPGGAFLKS